MSRDIETEVEKIEFPKYIRVLKAIEGIQESHLQLMLSGVELFMMYQKFAPYGGFPREISEGRGKLLSYSNTLGERIIALVGIVTEEPGVIK